MNFKSRYFNLIFTHNYNRQPLDFNNNESEISKLKSDLGMDDCTSLNQYSKSNSTTQNEEYRCLLLKEKIDDSDGSETESDIENISFFVILPDNPTKQIWDIIIGVLLIYTSIVTPYRISFIDDSTSANKYFDYLDLSIDCLFFIDIILSFLTAYYNNEEKIEKKLSKIAINYLTGWFIIDFSSIFPLNMILDPSKTFSTGSASRVSNALIRIAKIPKLYKLVKLTKLVKVVRVVKKRNISKITRRVLDKFRVNIHLERLFYYILGLFLFIHLSACVFYFIAKLEDFSPDCWVTRLGMIDKSPFEMYITSFYWSLTTVTTVGYGDVYSHTISERVYNLFIMSFGVVMYSFAIGFISSVVEQIDQKTSEMNEKLQALYQIKQEYDIDDEIYDKVRKLIKYDLTKSQTQKNTFLADLPNKLKVELSRIIHDNVIKKIIFFQDKQELVNFVAPLLKPMKYSQNENIYKIGDTPEESIFVNLLFPI